MSRTIEWSEWRVRRAGMAGKAAHVSERLGALRQTSSALRRDDADAAIITRMVRVEVDRRRAEGRLVRLGPRECEMRLRTTVSSPARNGTITS